METNYKFDVDQNLLEQKPVHSLYIKPTVTIYFMLFLGSVLLFMGSFKFILFGALIVGVSLFALLKIPNRKIVDMYPLDLIIYDQNQMPQYQIPWEAIQDWQYKTNVAASDRVYITTKNYESFSFESFKSNQTIKYLEKYAPGKERLIQVFGKKKK